MKKVLLYTGGARVGDTLRFIPFIEKISPFCDITVVRGTFAGDVWGFIREIKGFNIIKCITFNDTKRGIPGHFGNWVDFYKDFRGQVDESEFDIVIEGIDIFSGFPPYLSSFVSAVVGEKVVEAKWKGGIGGGGRGPFNLVFDSKIELPFLPHQYIAVQLKSISPEKGVEVLAEIDYPLPIVQLGWKDEGKSIPNSLDMRGSKFLDSAKVVKNARFCVGINSSMSVLSAYLDVPLVCANMFPQESISAINDVCWDVGTGKDDIRQAIDKMMIETK